MKKAFRKFIILFGISSVLAFVIMCIKGIFSFDGTISELMIILSDSFVYPGVLFLTLGLIMFIDGFGFFDGFAYSKYMITNVFKGVYKKENLSDYRERKSYRDFSKERATHRKKNDYVSLCTGVLFIVISIIFAFFV